MRSKVKELKQRLRKTWQAARTSLRSLRHGGDYQVWGNTRYLSSDWDPRTDVIARLIPPGARVLEFGAARMTLKDKLPEGCQYTPSDLVDRGAGTIVCDLNGRDLPSFPVHDIAVFGGVLEYINDVPRVITHVSKFADRIIASYVVSEAFPSTLERRVQGWVNDYNSSQFEEIFSRLGFRCADVSAWGCHRIFEFVRDGEVRPLSAGECLADSVFAHRPR